MSNNLLLSICIPTYNRSELLDKILEQLCLLVVNYDNVEIVISDNNSCDNTEEVVIKYQSQYSFIAYTKQVENLGSDKNFESVLKHAKAKYKWLLGDSWLINHSEFDKMVEELKNNPDTQLMIINRGEEFLPFQSCKYTSAELLLNHLGWHMTNMACLIYSSELINKANFTRYYNTNFIQLGIIFEYLSIQETVNVSFRNRPIIIMPDKEILQLKVGSWYPSKAWPIFVKCWSEIILSLPMSYSFETKKKCIADHNKYTHILNLRNTLIHRKENIYNHKVYKEHKDYIKYALGCKWGYFIISICPNFLNPQTYLKVLRPIKRILKYLCKR